MSKVAYLVITLHFHELYYAIQPNQSFIHRPIFVLFSVREQVGCFADTSSISVVRKAGPYCVCHDPEAAIFQSQTKFYGSQTTFRPELQFQSASACANVNNHELLLIS